MVTADDAATGDEQREGSGTNELTAEYIGGGEFPGTILGAIAGGGKSAAIGAAAGTGAGAGAQVLTRDMKVTVPAESFVVVPFGAIAPNVSGGQRNHAQRPPLSRDESVVLDP